MPIKEFIKRMIVIAAASAHGDDTGCQCRCVLSPRSRYIHLRRRFWTDSGVSLLLRKRLRDGVVSSDEELEEIESEGMDSESNPISDSIMTSTAFSSLGLSDVLTAVWIVLHLCFCLTP